MTAIQWRPQVNTLTKPQPCRPQVVPRGTAGYDEMAADLSAAHPHCNADPVLNLLDMKEGGATGRSPCKASTARQRAVW